MRLVSGLCAFALSMTVAVGSAFAESTTIAYPTADDPSFFIKAPGDWEFEAAEEEGDYFSLTGSTGATLYFRTVEATEDGLQDAIKETIDYVNDNYSEVDVEDPTEETLNGMDGFSAVGTGEDEAGDKYVFAFGWYILDDEELVEIWYEATADDEGAKDAAKIIESLSKP